MTVALLPKEGLIRINSVICPDHGDLLPEAFKPPFSADAHVLVLLPFACGVCYNEQGGADWTDEDFIVQAPDVDWEYIQEPLIQHIVDAGFDPDAHPQWFPIWAVKPDEVTSDGFKIYRTGTRLKTIE